MHKAQVTSVLIALSAFFVQGCGEDSPNEFPPQPASVQPAGRDFDANAVGKIHGQVRWTGKVPHVPAYESRPCPIAMEGLRERLVRENPNAPRIDHSTSAICGAVVFLREVALEKSRPWDLPPVRVEMNDRRLNVVQGDSNDNIGFVRQGDPVEFVSNDRWFHSIHARKAAFFALTFPDRYQLVKRRLETKGIVELSSGAGYYWMRAYLFVSDHPYFARSDEQGRFMLPQTPPGQYEIVCWLPNWKEVKHERDPDTALISRVHYGPGLEVRKMISVNAAATVGVDFAVSLTLDSQR